MKSIFSLFVFCVLISSCSFEQKEANIDLSRVNCITESKLAYRSKRLKEKEKIEIHFWSLGCNMREPLERSLFITKLKEEYRLSFCELTKEINKSELVLVLEDFQASLKKMDSVNMYSTTTQKVKIVIGENIYLGFDQSPWNEFYHLIDKLFQVAYFEQKDAVCK